MKELTRKFYDVYGKVKEELFLKPPFDLREAIKDDYDDEQDMIHDLPYAYRTDTNGNFILHMVILGKDRNNNFIGFGTGEEWGEEFILDADSIPVESLFQILEMLD